MLLLRLGFKKITASILGAHSSQITLPWGSQLPGELFYVLQREAKVARNWGQCLASSQGGNEVLSPKIREDLGPASHLRSERVEEAPPPAMPWDEAVAVQESLTATPWETLSQDHLAKPLLAFWLSKTASNNTALYYYKAAKCWDNLLCSNI